MKYQALQQKKDFIKDKIVIGIDPAKDKHQAVIVDKDGIQFGKSFHFSSDYEGFNKTLWEKISLQLPDCNPKTTVFAIETSINFWQNLSFYLFCKGFTVLLVSPLTTKHSRPLINHDFSKTDPKDALLVATNSQNGFFDLYKSYSPFINSMHSLAITYYKINKQLSQNKARIRAFIENIFPELMDVLQPDILTSRYLLKKYFLPQDFINLNFRTEALAISKISRKQHGIKTLLQLRDLAFSSVGVPKTNQEIISSRITLDSWLNILDTLEKQLNLVSQQLISLAKLTPYFDIICNFKGISDISTALFIAETRDLSLFNNFKQIEKLAGHNLYQSISGRYNSTKHISHIGNRRLSLVLFKIAEETSKYIPEVRIKYIKRQLKFKNHTKNVIACVPVILKLIFSTVKHNKTYEFNPKNIAELQSLEIKYQNLKKKSFNKLAA